MKFSPPAKHQKKYLLGACAALLVIVVYFAKNGPVHHAEMAVSAQETTAEETVPSRTVSSTVSELKPIASSTEKTSPAAPSSPLDGISAEAYIVGNAATGQIYFSKNPTLENGLASISKLFTAIVARKDMDPNEMIQITPAMLAVYPNSYGVLLGEKFALHDLLYGMLLQSNNNLAEGVAMAYSSPDTYITAASGTSPSEAAFIEKMNELAASLGLSNTHFVDASGLDAGNVTDAHDLFSFAQYLYKNQQPLLGITDTYSYTVATTTDHLGHDFVNIDPFVGDPHYIGGKTGRTDLAGEDMFSIFNYKSPKGVTYPIVVIVLHSALSERQIDSSELYLQAIDKINGTQ